MKSIFKPLLLCLSVILILQSCNTTEKSVVLVKGSTNQWPMSGGPDGSWKVQTNLKVPTEWSVRNGKNIKWRKTLEAGGQSGIAVWGDKIFFTINMPSNDLPYSEIVNNFEKSKQNYQDLFSDKVMELTQNSDSKFKLLQKAFNESTMHWESLLKNNKEYQNANENKQNRIENDLKSQDKTGILYDKSAKEYYGYIYNKYPEVELAYNNFTKLSKDIKGGKRDTDILLLCLNANSGETLWSQRIKGLIETEYNNGFSDATSPCPITDGEYVWALNACGGMACFTLDGKLVWDRTWEPSMGRPFNKQFDSILFEDYILSCEPPEEGDTTRIKDWNYLHAFDKKTGKRLWITKEAMTHYNTPVLGETYEGKPAVLIGRGGPHEVPERPVGLSLISLETGVAGNAIWHWEPTEPNAVSGWGALSTQHWDKEKVSWFDKGENHLNIDSKTGAFISQNQLKEGKQYLFNEATKQYDLNLNASLPHSENERHCNMLVGDYLYYMVRYQPYIARHNTVTGENVFLEVPREINEDGSYIWKVEQSNDGLNSKGQLHSSDVRIQGHGFQKCFLGSPTLINNNIYFTNALGMVYVIDTTSENFDGKALVSVNDLGKKGQTWTVNSLSFANGNLYHRTLKEIICIGN
jgi:outer membrane protein assembly factor BamB